MANILYLVHRLPYPPNKGDKVRSFHLLKHLARQHRVYLGSFVDDPADWPYLDTLKPFCAEVRAVGLKPGLARLASLRGLLGAEALSLPYYRSSALSDWVRELASRVELDAVVVFSSPMAQYARLLPELPMLVDFVDVDSAKWTAYAESHAWPQSWLYGREGRELLRFEQATAEQARCSFFVTEQESDLFRRLSPALAAPVEDLGNGVDADFFAPDAGRASPFRPGERALVFTGAMDYWPNVDAVSWFAAEVFPGLRQRHPDLVFCIVGRSPTPAVQKLAAEPGVRVTGTVDDVRPYLQHAAAVVAPLRVARGIQNKVLEAMAMARPVLAARGCAEVIDAEPGVHLLAAADADDYRDQLLQLLDDPARAERIGAAGRACVLARYSWDARLAAVDRHLESMTRKEIAA